MGFFNLLEEIIVKDGLSLSVKSVALLTLSNMYMNNGTDDYVYQISEETRVFSKNIMLTWEEVYERNEEPIEIIRNAIYASVILFYNLIFSRCLPGNIGPLKLDSIERFVANVTEKVIPTFGDDTLISRVLLDFIALMTKEPDTTTIILSNEILIDYCFRKLMNPLVTHTIYENPYSSRGGNFNRDKKPEVRTTLVPEPRLIKLSSLALGCLAHRIDEYTCDPFRLRLKEMTNLDNVLSGIKDLSMSQVR